MPAVGGDSIDWSLYDEDGNLNTGLVCFVVLSAACLGVWAAGIASWLSYRRCGGGQARLGGRGRVCRVWSFAYWQFEKWGEAWEASAKRAHGPCMATANACWRRWWTAW